MKFDIRPKFLTALSVVFLSTTSCSVPYLKFEELCEDNFAFEVHSDELWTQFIDAAAPHLLTPGMEGHVIMPNSDSFRVLNHYSYACGWSIENGANGDLKAVNECPEDTPVFGFVTLVWPNEQRVDGSTSDEVVFEPIATFSNMAISESSNEGRKKDCFVRYHDQYVSRAYSKWKSE